MGRIRNAIKYVVGNVAHVGRSHLRPPRASLSLISDDGDDGVVGVVGDDGVEHRRPLLSTMQ